MNSTNFTHNNKKYKISSNSTNDIRNYKNQNLISFNTNYRKCFNSHSELKNTLTFTENRGLTILVSNDLDETIFFCSLIKNIKTNGIEIYNVCKDFQKCDITPYRILSNIINYFIKNNPFFTNYNTIRLAVIRDNKFLIPAVITYCKLGFSIDINNTELIINIAPHITMSRSVYDKKQIDYNNEFKKIGILLK